MKVWSSSAQRIKVSHSRVSRADETLNVDDESITIRIETAPAVGSTEVLGHTHMSSLFRRYSSSW